MPASGPVPRLAIARDSIASGALSRATLVERALTRAEEQRRLKAFVVVASGSARSAAVAGDVARGTTLTGPLDGAVVAVKDNLDTFDLSTSGGARSLARATPPVFDAFAVARVRAAGGIVIGKTNLDTWARGVRSHSEVVGQTENAVLPGRSAGGSSGGTAVAIAAGMATVGLGSDTCGSLRYPAAYNGIYGLRPTAGLVSRSGLIPLAPTQDVVGPMAATIDELRAVLAVISGPDPNDPLTLTAADARANTPDRVPGAKLRVGVVTSMVDAASPAIRDVIVARLAAIDRDRVELVGVRLPSLVNASVIDDEAMASRVGYLAQRQQGRAQTIGALSISSRAYASRLAAQRATRQALLELLDRVGLDVLAYPTTPFLPAPLGARQLAANCYLAATTGLPALTVPLGAPVGLDLLGRPFSEPLLLDAAAVVAGFSATG